MTKARDLANASTALSAVSSAELAFLDGVTSAVQTQLDAKQASSTAVTLTGTQTLTNKTLTSPVISSVINNTLTSTTGDMIYASAANTPTRLGIGSAGQVLTVASGIPSWATASSGGMTLIQTLTLSGSSVTSSSITASYKNLYIVGRGIYNASSGDTQLLIRFNSDTGNNYSEFGVGATNNNSNIYYNIATSRTGTGSMSTSSAYNQVLSFDADIARYSETENKSMNIVFQGYSTSYTYYGHGVVRAVWSNTAAITTLTFYPGAGTFAGGSIYIYGVN